GLLTMKGARALEAANAVVYDRLVNDALLDLTSAACERIYAGKLATVAGSSQDQINTLLVRLARQGKLVVRLKGGDPFVFGRGGEEGEALANAGIAYEVIPGVTSATAVPAYAGIPVSHRGVASSFAVLTGHEDASKPESAIRWDQIASGVDTLVCLMGVQALPEIAVRLLAAGLSPTTPAAVIAWGTLPRQRVVVGQLADIAARTREAGVEPPAVAVFGEVVRLREKLQWFETRPLFGRRIVVTRTRDQASGLRSLLEEEGAVVLELPTLEIVDGASPQVLTRVIGALADGEYAWVVFTSANAVRRFLRAVYDLGRDARAFHSSKVAVVGPATAQSLAEYGIRADLMPEDYRGRGLADVLIEHELTRRRVLVPRAEAASPDLVSALRTHGAEVEDVPLYSSEVPRNPDPGILAQIREGAIDVVTFASSSAVRNLAKMLGKDLSGLKQTVIGCIGPSTAETAQRCGLTPTVVAVDHTIPGLVSALRAHFQRSTP
ncbi:MAG TPA: uroporphyrinogen-III C-methyltransferase, partial [Dehalococcoidia bacterium]|nr:uroporphyrinogen-III C-methyltransferase [Dehalococcoidia bacterium]